MNLEIFITKFKESKFLEKNKPLTESPLLKIPLIYPSTDKLFSWNKFTKKKQF